MRRFAVAHRLDERFGIGETGGSVIVPHHLKTAPRSALQSGIAVQRDRLRQAIILVCAARSIKRSVPGWRADVGVRAVPAATSRVVKRMRLEQNLGSPVRQKPASPAFDIANGFDHRDLAIQICRGGVDVRIGKLRCGTFEIARHSFLLRNFGWTIALRLWWAVTTFTPAPRRMGRGAEQWR